jgi:hypothetical protein
MARTRDDEIETRAGKRQRAHVARLHRDALRHAFERRVPDRDVAGVAGLVSRDQLLMLALPYMYFWYHSLW